MNHQLKKAFGIIIALCIIQTAATAQQGALITVRDFEVWSAAEIKYEASEKWTLGLEQQLRMRDNASEVDQYFTEFNMKKDVSKSFYYSLGFRYIRDNDNQGDIQGYENNFRYNLDFGYKHKVQKFDVNYRVRFQRRNEIGLTRAEGDEANNHLRLRVAAKYNIKKWKLDPEASSEIFYNLQQGEHFNKFRLTLSTKYKLKKYGALGAFYRIEKALATSYPKTTHIAGIEYNYTIKRKKKND